MYSLSKKEQRIINNGNNRNFIRELNLDKLNQMFC